MGFQVWIFAALGVFVWTFGAVYIGIFIGLRMEREDQYQARGALNGNVVQRTR